MTSEDDEQDPTSPIEEDYDPMLTPKPRIYDVLEGYRFEEAESLFQFTREQYDKNRHASMHGTANPSDMDNPFWKFQAGPGGLSAWSARQIFGDTNYQSADSMNPVWCFIRYGSTLTKLPDGRIICIGGEHEDHYDPDFCIYNGECS